MKPVNFITAPRELQSVPVRYVVAAMCISFVFALSAPVLHAKMSGNLRKPARRGKGAAVG